MARSSLKRYNRKQMEYQEECHHMAEDLGYKLLAIVGFEEYVKIVDAIPGNILWSEQLNILESEYKKLVGSRKE